MKTYSEASRFPLVEVGKVQVPKLVLGHLPFAGETHQGAARNKECAIRFSRVANITKILERAVNRYGITVVANTPAVQAGPAARLLEAVKETSATTSVELALIPCFMIPMRLENKRLDDYRRWITYYQIEKERSKSKGLLGKYVDDPILQCGRDGWKEKFQNALSQLQPYAEDEIKKLEIDYERLRTEIRSLDGLKVLFAEPGAETDFLAMIGRFDLLDEFTNSLRDSLHCPIILASHHAGTTIPILEANDVAFDAYLTPVNKLGVMMFPSQRSVLNAIRNAKKPVIAMKTLAGGRIQPKDALQFVYNKPNIVSCIVGVASEEEVDDDAQAAEKVLRLTS